MQFFGPHGYFQGKVFTVRGKTVRCFLHSATRWGYRRPLYVLKEVKEFFFLNRGNPLLTVVTATGVPIVAFTLMF